MATDIKPTEMDRGRYLPADYHQIISDAWKMCASDLIKIACPALRRAMAAESEVDRLRVAIRQHRDERGDDRCHTDDGRLYAVLPEGDTRPARETAVTLENCTRYIECRQTGREYISWACAWWWSSMRGRTGSMWICTWGRCARRWPCVRSDHMMDPQQDLIDRVLASCPGADVQRGPLLLGEWPTVECRRPDRDGCFGVAVLPESLAGRPYLSRATAQIEHPPPVMWLTLRGHLGTAQAARLCVEYLQVPAQGVRRLGEAVR